MEEKEIEEILKKKMFNLGNSEIIIGSMFDKWDKIVPIIDQIQIRIIINNKINTITLNTVNENEAITQIQKIIEHLNKIISVLQYSPKYEIKKVGENGY